MNDIQKQMFVKAITVFCENITRELKQFVNYAESIKLDKADIGQPSIDQIKHEAKAELVPKEKPLIDLVSDAFTEILDMLAGGQGRPKGQQAQSEQPAEHVGNNDLKLPATQPESSARNGDSQAVGVCPDVLTYQAGVANKAREQRLQQLIAEDLKEIKVEPVGYHLNEIAKQLNDSTLNNISQVATGISDLKENYEKQIEELFQALKKVQAQSEAHQNEKVEWRDRCRVLGNRVVQIQSILNEHNA